jgi:hypothetical protein
MWPHNGVEFGLGRKTKGAMLLDRLSGRPRLDFTVDLLQEELKLGNPDLLSLRQWRRTRCHVSSTCSGA